MITTYGLTHISLSVRDPARSLDFYTRVFGVKEYFRDTDQIQAQGPGPYDIIAFEKNDTLAGRPGGIGHFGFRLTRPEDLADAIAQVELAGGTLLRQGEYAPGFPFAHVADPDGYQIELWFE